MEDRKYYKKRLKILTEKLLEIDTKLNELDKIKDEVAISLLKFEYWTIKNEIDVIKSRLLLEHNSKRK